MTHNQDYLFYKVQLALAFVVLNLLGRLEEGHEVLMLVKAERQVQLLADSFSLLNDLPYIRVEVDMTWRLWMQTSSALDGPLGRDLLPLGASFEFAALPEQFADVLVVLTLLRKAVILQLEPVV